MTFADVTAKPSSERFTLLRVTPARCIDSSLVAQGGGVYQMAWTQPVARLERNGTALTLVTSLTGDDQFTFDEGTGTLQVQLAAAPDDATNVLVLFFYLFFTSGNAIMATEDPLDSSTPVRQWQPRIKTEPVLSQTTRNITQGVFTLADTSVDLANADFFLSQFLGANDSWGSKDADVWLGVRVKKSDTPAYERIYKGKVIAVQLQSGVATVSFYDSFSRLSQPALMGDTPSEAYYQAITGSYPNVNPSDAGKPVPFFIGRFSRYHTKNDPQFKDDIFEALDPSAMPEAVCVSFSATVSTTTNRTWALGRCPSEGFRSWSVPSFTGTPIGGGGSTIPSWVFMEVGTTALAATDIAVGDRVTLAESGVGTHHARIYNVDLVGGWIGFMFNSTTGYSYTTAATVTTSDDPVVVLVDENGQDYYLTPGVDYTASTSATSGGNLLVEITFADDFESGLIPSNGFPATFAGPLDPAKHHVFFRLRLKADAYAKHGDVLSKMTTAAGLTVNDASFTAANTALPVNCAMQIPYFDESDFKAYLDYAEDILASTLGFVALNSSAQVTYALIAAPSATDDTGDNTVLGDGDAQAAFTVTVDYADVVTGLIAYNPHNASAAATSASPSPSETRYNAKAQYLHGLQNAVQFRHVLETITDRIAALLAARSNRRATFSFSAATRYLDAKLGDDAELTTAELLGSDTARSVKIVSLGKSADQVTAQGIDLLGVT